LAATAETEATATETNASAAGMKERCIGRR
jgi:hypothetical protein